MAYTPRDGIKYKPESINSSKSEIIDAMPETMSPSVQHGS